MFYVHKSSIHIFALKVNISENEFFFVSFDALSALYCEKRSHIQQGRIHIVLILYPMLENS